LNNDKIGMMWAQQFENSGREEAVSPSIQPLALPRRMSLRPEDFTKDI
jgi:hypothetical protein